MSCHPLNPSTSSPLPNFMILPQVTIGPQWLKITRRWQKIQLQNPENVHWKQVPISRVSYCLSACKILLIAIVTYWSYPRVAVVEAWSWSTVWRLIQDVEMWGKCGIKDKCIWKMWQVLHEWLSGKVFRNCVIIYKLKLTSIIIYQFMLVVKGVFSIIWGAVCRKGLTCHIDNLPENAKFTKMKMTIIQLLFELTPFLFYFEWNLNCVLFESENAPVIFSSKHIWCSIEKKKQIHTT